MSGLLSLMPTGYWRKSQIYVISPITRSWIDWLPTAIVFIWSKVITGFIDSTMSEPEPICHWSEIWLLTKWSINPSYIICKSSNFVTWEAKIVVTVHLITSTPCATIEWIISWYRCLIPSTPSNCWIFGI